MPSDAFRFMSGLYESCPYTKKRSWRTINKCLGDALDTAIEMDMAFDLEDFQLFSSQLKFGYWGGNSIGAHTGEHFYSLAARHHSLSALKSYEHYVNREPFLFGNKRRAAIGSSLLVNKEPMIVTSFGKNEAAINVAAYAYNDGVAKITRRMALTRDSFKEGAVQLGSKYAPAIESLDG